MDPRVLLKSPFVYEVFQRLVGGMSMRKASLDLLAPRAGQRVLDVGCGPAYYVSDLADVEYHGFDTNQRYIDHAQTKFAGRGRFYCQIFDREAADRLGLVDRVLLMGLLHHIDDGECASLLELLASILKPGGVIVALDTVVHDKQNGLERALARGDRGEFVRYPDEFCALARRSFGEVEGCFSEKVWIPSIYWLMTMKTPLRASHAENQTNDTVDPQLLGALGEVGTARPSVG